MYLLACDPCGKRCAEIGVRLNGVSLSRDGISLGMECVVNGQATKTRRAGSSTERLWVLDAMSRCDKTTIDKRRWKCAAAVFWYRFPSASVGDLVPPGCLFRVEPPPDFFLWCCSGVGVSFNRWYGSFSVSFHSTLAFFCFLFPKVRLFFVRFDTWDGLVDPYFHRSNHVFHCLVGCDLVLFLVLSPPLPLPRLLLAW